MSLWRLMGKLVFWSSLPALAIYLRLRVRTRVLVVSEGKVLVVRPWMGHGLWKLPGGGLHAGEDPTVGAVREVREEAGLILIPSTLKSLGTTEYRRAGIRFRYHQFIAEMPALIEPTKGAPEVLDAAWIDPDSLNAHNADNDVLNLLSKWQRLP